MKLLILLSVLALGSCVDLQAKYPFSVVLLDEGGEYYGLHWNFTRSTESIYFAVNVSTTGWVGFGLSPNGGMTGSDVVIGWVDGENSYFHDRYAEGTFLPPIDQSQDWFLINSEEENGFTVLEFSRNFTTCDDRDRDITGSTDRVVWSFRGQDPTGPTGADALRHDRRGTASVNLLGGLPTGNREISGDEPTLDILVNNVEIPDASTTYWCRSIALPEALINQTHYINRFSPILTSHPRQYVHHILIYLCTDPLAPEEVGVSVPCNQLPRNANDCRGQLLIGAWAVGGDDFTYPEGISYPVGGSGQEHFAVMEMHYDNPNNDLGVVDNSGLSFFYTTEQPEQEAGIIFLGSGVTPSMVIPPGADNFTITGVCSMECTNEFIPEEGIRIFASVLHTHLIGREVTIQHFRRNPDCDALEELEPIDQNLNYDFNFQQLVYLPREHVVLPGDILVVKCVYDSSRNTEVTLGGESTLEEMCLSFPVYYPRPPNGKSLVNCISLPAADVGSFNGFIDYLQQDDRYSDAADELIAAAAAGRAGDAALIQALNDIDWGSDRNLAIAAQDSVLRGNVYGYCNTEDGSEFRGVTTTPVADCSYQAADQCTGFEPLSCCERLSAGAPSQMQINLSASIFMILMSIITVAFY